MSKPLSALTRITELIDGALIYIVDLTRTSGDQSVGITKQDFANDLGEATGEPVSYSAIWTGTGLQFLVTADVYYINDTILTATADVVTLDAAHATLDRLDYVGAFANGTVGKVTGTPASSSLVNAPNFDALDFFPIKLVLVKAADTTPSDPNTGDPATTTLIFDEDTGAPTEFNLSLIDTIGTLAVTTTDPYSGTKSIEAINVNLNDQMRFTWTSFLHTDDIDAVSWWTKMGSDITNSNIHIAFYNGTKIVGAQTRFGSGENGFDSSNLDWQKITINRDSFARIKSGEYDSIRVIYYTGFLVDWFFDKFELHSGSTPLPPEDSCCTANETQTNTSNFDNNLSAADTTVQLALDTLDDLVVGGTHEGYEETGTRVGGDLDVTIGDYDESGNGTRLNIDDGTGDFDAYGANFYFTTTNPLNGIDLNDDGGLSGWYADGNGNFGGFNANNIIDIDLTSLKLYAEGSTGNGFHLIFPNTTTFKEQTLQDKTGTIALLSDITAVGDELMGYAFGDETTDIESGTTVISYAMPNFATVLSHVSVNLKTAPTGSTAIFDLNEGGVSVLSTKISIDATETNSETAATPPVISDSAIAANAIMTLDIDQKGSTIAGVAPKMWLYFTRA